MRISRYQRQTVEPDSAGGVLMQGAGTSELGAAKGLSTLQQATMELAERSAEAKRTTDVMLRSLSLRQSYGNWWAQRSTDPSGYATLAAESDKALQTLARDAIKGVDDPLAQAALQREILQFQVQAGIEARTTQIKQQVEWSRGALDEQLHLRRQEIARTPPVERERLMGQSLDMIYAAAGAGYISPLEAEKKARGFTDGVAEDELALRVYHDPEQVLEDMYTGAYDAMSVDARQRVIINAERRAEALRDERIAGLHRDESASRQRAKDVQELNFGTYYDFVVRGQMTETALREALDKREIDGTQYKQLLDANRAIREDGGPGNPSLADTLRIKAQLGTLSWAELRQAMIVPNGINKPESDELVGLLTTGGAVTNSRTYKEAAKFLTGSLSVAAKAGPYGLTGETSVIASMALAEFYQRVQTAGDDSGAMQIAREIVGRYQQEAPESLPKPRYQSMDDAKRAHRRGDLSFEEFNAEAYLHQLLQGSP